MDKNTVINICREELGQTPLQIDRCMIGHGNYVCAATCGTDKYIVRCSREREAYRDTVKWLERLRTAGIPVPEVIACGVYDDIQYLILTYIEGNDIGEVYSVLDSEDKRRIAREVAAIQNKAAAVQIDDLSDNWSWMCFIDEMLDRAEKRINDSGYFEAEKVNRLRVEKDKLSGYFASIMPIPYLDDISTKNLLVRNGSVSGVIDVDWIGVGDRLTFAALTYIALLNMECDTDYVDFLLEELRVSDVERKAVLFYSLMFSVDFMGERGMRFDDKVIEVNDRVISRLNGIYDSLWEQWNEK